MDNQFVVAQAGSKTAGATGTPVQTIKITKPAPGQTEIFHASFNGTVKVDLTAIADQKITLYHDNSNQTLHIIFADGSQAIIEPFFDSTGNVLPNLLVEVAPDQDLTGVQFTAQFPMTDDGSVVPAAGNGGTNASGADFHDPSVDPLNVPPPLGLLPPEELPPVTFTELQGAVLTSSNLIPTVSGTLVGVVEEEALNQETVVQPTEAGQGNEDTHDASGNDQDTADFGPGSQVTTQTFSGTLAPLVIGGDLPITFLTNVAADGTNVHDNNGNNVTSIGDVVTYERISDNEIDGVTNGEDGHRLIFKLLLNSDGTFTFILNDQIDHPTHSDDNSTTNPSHTPGIFEETLNLDLSSAIDAHDVNGDHPPGGFPPNTFDMGVIDDTPIANDSTPDYPVQVIEDGSGTIFISASGLDDENQANGIDGGPGDDGFGKSVSGTLHFSPGADNYNTVFFSTDLTVTATDGVTTETLDHLQAIYVDSDGIAHTEDVTLAWTANSSGGGTLLGTMDTGADGIKDVFTLTVDKFGHYTFALDAPLSHPFNADPNSEGSTAFEDNLNLQFTYSVTDGDGDQADAHLTINVDDDVPTATDTVPGSFSEEGHEFIAAAPIDDEGATANTGFTGNEGGNGDVPGTANTTSGFLNFAAGADGLSDLTFASLDGQAAAFEAIYKDVNGAGAQETVTYSWDESTHTLTATGDTSGNTVFTLTIDDVATGHFTFELDSALVHSDVDETGNISLVLPFTVTDGDGDQATANLTIQVNDDTPTIAPSQECVDQTLDYTGIKAGHVDERGLDGAGDHDVLLSGAAGVGANGTGGTGEAINTTGNDIGVANQWIDGETTNGNNLNPAETLRLDFVNSLTFTGNGPSSDFNYSGHYLVDEASFTVEQIQGKPGSTATVFVQVFDANDSKVAGSPENYNDDGSPLAIAASDIHAPVGTTLTAVYDGGNIVGFVIEGLHEGDTVTVDTVDDFNRLNVTNYDGVTATTDSEGGTTEFQGAAFSVGGIESEVCSPPTLGVSIDESPGVNTGADPNPSNDVDPGTAPTALTDAITTAGLTALGFAESQGSLAKDLFNVNFGADGENPTNGLTFTLTQHDGSAFDGQNSGLTTTVGGHEIDLYTDPSNSNIVWGVANGNLDTGEKVFALYLDGDGHLWVSQFEAIANPVAGDTQAAHDDIASIQQGLVYVTATATDGDGDQATAVSPASIEVNFQDDGPTVSATLDQHFSVVLDETPGPQTAIFGGDDNDTLFNGFLGFGAKLPPEVQAAFDSVQNTGNDPDVSNIPFFGKDYDDLGRGALGFAINSSTAALDVNAVFGTDGPATHNSEVFSLTLNGTSGQVDSGIQTTEGKEIYLTLEGGVIVGRVLADGHTSVTTDDSAAFAIAIDDNGHVATAEWLSLHHNSADVGHDSDEAVYLASGTVSATVTITDGDGDTATASADISGQIGFEDDGPSVDVGQAGSIFQPVHLSPLTLDESIGTMAGDSNAALDDNGAVTTPSFLTTPDSTLAIGILSTPTSANGTSVADLFNVNVSFGADGPQSAAVYNYNLVLKDDHHNTVSAGSSTGVETNLVVTNLDGAPYEGDSVAQRTIYLFHALDGSIVGRVGNDPNGDVALHIVITGSASDPQITVEQYVPIEHPNTGNPDDSQSLTFDDHDASLAINLTVTATDGDGDTATDSKSITLADHSNSFVTIQDDGPVITSFYASGTVVQDETPGVQDAGDPNPANDVASSGLPTGVLAQFDAVTNKGVDPDVSVTDHNAIGFATSAASIVNVTADFGTDGPALSNAQVLSLAVNGGNGADSGLQTTDGHEIFLFKEGNLIVGRYDGDNSGTVTDGFNNTTLNPNGSFVDPAAFAIALGQDGNISVAQYVSLKNPIPGSTPADLDEPTTGLQNIQATLTLTDGDGDHTSQTIDISSSIAFQDDGPSVSVSVPDSVGNSFFFDGFTLNGNIWGSGSGIDTGPTSGPWTISDANVGHSGADLIPDTGSGTVQLERVGDGYDGGTGTPMHTSTNGFMVDLDASPRDVELSQVINGLTNGESYLLTFEAGASVPADAHLEVWFGGQKVFDLDPTNSMQIYSLELFGGQGDHSNLLEFRETGAPDNHGTYLANVTMGDVIVIDETPGIQLDSNETTDAGVIGLFSGVANPGTDPDMPPQYATGSAAAINATANFGADGPLNGNAVTATVFSLTTVNGTDSGLATTEGKEIFLFKEGNLIVGRYDGDSSGTVTDGFDNTTHLSDGSSVDPAAFAIAMDSTGKVSVALYVSLEHPDQATFGNGFNSYDEGIYLNSGTLSATVTVTDGDGDSASQSGDISKAIRFEDDGPTVSGVTYDQHGSNLIVNGSFEQGHPELTGSDWSIYSAIPGWSEGTDGIPFEIQVGAAGGLAAQDGNALVELDGDTFGNPNHQPPQGTPDPVHTDATIQQTIATTAGEDYVLSFWYAPRPDHSAGDDSGLKVMWNGTVVDTIDSSTQPAGWQQITLHVTGTGNDVLAFQGTGPENENGALIDNVSLNSVNPTLDDEDIHNPASDGIQGGPGDDGSGLVATGQIQFNAGADGLKQIEVGTIAGLQAIYVDSNGVGHPESVSQSWTPDGFGGGTLLGSTTDIPTVFTLVVDNTGHYTFTLNAPLDHPLTDDPTTAATETSFEDNLLLGFGFTVTDGDGDQATGTISINVDDDSPAFVADAETHIVGIQDATVATLGVGVTENLDIAFGADGEHANGNGVADGLVISNWTDLDGVTETLSDDGKTLTATIDNTNGPGTGDDTVLYVLQLNSDGTYTFTQDATLPGSSSVLPTETLSDSYGPVTSHDYGDFTLTALNGGTMNGSSAGAGVNDNNMNVGDAFNVTFDQQMQSANLGINFAGSGSLHLHWVALAQDGTTVIGSGDTATFNADGTITITPPGGFYELDVTVDLDSGNANSPKFKLTSVGGDTEGSNPIDHLTFQVGATDGDGDSVADSFQVHLASAPPLEQSIAFSGVVEEEQLSPAGTLSSFAGNEDTGSADGNDQDFVDTNGFNDVTTNVAFGVDSVIGGSGGIYLYSLDSSFEGQQAQFTSGLGGITSQGAPVLLHVDGATLTGYVDEAGSGATTGHYDAGVDRVVFTLAINPGTGIGLFTLHDNIDHNTTGPGGQFGDNVEGTLSLNLDGIVVATDSAAHSLALKGSVDIIDDTPVTSDNQGVFLNDEAATTTYDTPNAGGDGDFGASSATVSGTLAHSYGADGPGSLLLTGVTLPDDGGFTKTLSDDGKTLTIHQDQGGANPVDVIQITLSDTTAGDYTVEQLHPIFDPTPGTTEESVSFFVNYQVTDGDGDTVSGELTISSNDDTPVIGHLGAVIYDALTVDESVGDHGLSDPNANDEATVTLPTALTDYATTNHLTLIGAATENVSLSGDDLHFGADGPATGGGVTRGFTLVDTGNNAIADGTNSGLFLTAFGPGEGLPIFLFHDGDMLVGRAGETATLAAGNPAAFAIYLDPDTGSLSLAQYHALQHDDPNDPDQSTTPDVLNLHVHELVTITDGDGDSTSATRDGSVVTFNFEDDGPTLNIVDTPNTVDETQTISGTWTLDGGSDGVVEADVSIGSVHKTLVMSAGEHVSIGSGDGFGLGTLTVSADGTWSFAAGGVSTDTPFTFTIKATDLDGDSSQDSQTVTVDFNPIEQIALFSGTVEEEQFGHGSATSVGSFVGNEDTSGTGDADTNPPFVDNTTNVTTGDLSTLITGIDGTASYSFNVIDGSHATYFNGVTNVNLTSQGHDVLLDVIGNTLYGFVNVGGDVNTYQAGTDRPVFTLDLNPSNGQFTFTLLDNIDHTGAQFADNVEGTFPINLDGLVQVTDSADGETRGLDLSVNVIDDTPVADTSGTAYLNDESATHTYATPNAGGTGDVAASNDTGTLVHSYGADGPGSLTLSGYQLPQTGGFSAAITDGGKVLTISQLQNGNEVDVVKMTLSDTTSGHYTIEELNPVFHPTSSTTEESLNFSVNYDVVDGDGDLSTGAFTINVNDDTPVADDANLAVNAGTTGATPFHLTYLIDVSASISSADMKTALTAFLNLTNAYIAEGANLSVEVIRFRGSADTPGSTNQYDNYSAHDLNNLVTLLNNEITTLSYFAPGTVLGSGTNYQAGLTAVKSYLDTVSAADGFHNVVYMFTDGDPTEGSITSAASMTTFLSSSGLGTDITNLNAEVHTFGVGNSVTATGQAILGAFDNTPSSPINVTNYADLESALLGTVGPSGSTTGNVLTDGSIHDSFGADGPHMVGTHYDGIVSIQVDGHAYTYDGTSIGLPGGNPAGATASGGTLNVDTALGGHLTFYFTDVSGHTAGDYTYTAPASVPSDQTETFAYTIEDGDGDTASANINITVHPAPNAPPALALHGGDFVLDQFSAVSYSNNDGTVNWNGNWTEGTTGSGSENTSPTSGDITVTGGHLQFGSGIDGGEFVTRAVDLSGASAATVTLDIASSHLGSGRDVVLQAWDGSTWQNLITMAGTGTVTAALTAAEISASSAIRLHAEGSWDSSGTSNDGSFTADNIKITYTLSSPVTNYTTTYTENGAGVSIVDVTVAITDGDSPNMQAAHIVLTNEQAGDFLAINGTQVHNGDTGLDNGINYTVTDNGSQVVIDLAGTHTQADYQTAIDAITFASSSENPSAVDRSITAAVTDDHGNVSNTATTTVHVVDVNDPPVFAATASTLTLVSNTGSGAVTFSEDAFAHYFHDVDSPSVGIFSIAGSGLSGGSPSGTNLGDAAVGTVGTITVDDNNTLGATLTVIATDGSLHSPSTDIDFDNHSTSTLTLDAAPTGDSVIVNSQSGAATLNGGAGNDYIIGNSGADTLTGGAGDDTLQGNGGNDRFVLDGHSALANGHDTITDFASLADEIFVDVATQSLTIGTATAVASGDFHSVTGTGGADETNTASWNGGGSPNGEFLYNQNTHELWYSAAGTGTDKIDLAHLSTGTPVAGDIHTF